VTRWIWVWSGGEDEADTVVHGAMRRREKRKELLACIQVTWIDRSLDSDSDGAWGSRRQKRYPIACGSR
jgi:hypothetical protein